MRGFSRASSIRASAYPWRVCLRSKAQLLHGALIFARRSAAHRGNAHCLSMNDTPLPFVVRAMIMVGLPVHCELASTAAMICSKSWPSIRMVRQPKASHFGRQRVERHDVFGVAVGLLIVAIDESDDDCRACICWRTWPLPRPALPGSRRRRRARSIAASPRFSLAASAMPAAVEMPSPSVPVEASMPGVLGA